MNNVLLDTVKQASYLLWESLQFDEPLVLWNCVEDIACFFEANNIITESDMIAILKIDRYNIRYIDFMRNISYRIYYYTDQKIPVSNWYFAERLMNNSEWRMSISRLAGIFRERKNEAGFVAGLHNEKIKEYYGSLIQT